MPFGAALLIRRYAAAEGARHKNPRAAYVFSLLSFGDGAPRCRRLRGSGEGTALFHGLTPTAKCGRRIRGFLETRAVTRE